MIVIYLLLGGKIITESAAKKGNSGIITAVANEA